MSTHIFRLPSGVECEVSEFVGKHQKLLTQQGKKTHNEKLSELLADVIVRVGTVTEIDTDFIDTMLACDKKMALVEARQYTLGFEDFFTFHYKYTDKEGNKAVHEHDIPINEGKFPFSPVMVDQDGKLVPAAYEEYSDIQKDIFMTLPRSKEDIRFTMLDGRGETIGAATTKNNRSSHTALEMRRPVWFKKKEGGQPTPIKINLDNMSFVDIEALRKRIQEVEGRVDTEIMFEHPESEVKPQSEKEVVIDVLGTPAFFFPSEAI